MRQKRKARALAAEAAGAELAPADENLDELEAAEPEAQAEPEPDADADAEAQADPELIPDEEPDADLGPAPGLSAERLKSVIESLLFAAEKPLTIAQLRQLSGEKDAGKVQAAIDLLVADYTDRGVVLHDVAGGYQFRTQPANSDFVQRLVAGRPVRLSRAQLETLAIIAYRQPVTRPEIDEIRGVDSGSTLKVLLDRDLVRVLGKKEEPGRPLLYGTSKGFLEFFNLRDLRDLPTLREFHELSEESLREVEELDRSDDAPAAGAATDSTIDESGDDDASASALN